MGRRKRDLEFWETTSSTARAFLHYYYALTQIALSIAKWEGLPDSIDPIFLEKILHTDGEALFFKDEVMGYMVSRVNLLPPYDQNDIPITRYAYSNKNNYHNELNNTNSVIIRNDYLYTATKSICEYYADRLYKADRIMSVNLNAQKTPILVLCDENERLTLKNLYMKYEGNVPFIFGEKSLNPKSLQVLTTNAPYLVDKLQMSKMSIWSEALMFLGVSNISYEKNERVTINETIQAQGGTYAIRTNKICARKTDAEKINEMFGLDINVNFNDEINKEALLLRGINTEEENNREEEF